MRFGAELVKDLQNEMQRYRDNMENRDARISNGLTDIDDCFISQRNEERSLNLCKDKIDLINDGGCAWFTEYATTDGVLVEAHWCNTKYGSKLRVTMPDESIVWTSATTKNGLTKIGLKKVLCKRPAWFAFHSSQGGMLGVYTGQYITFASDFNYATGEDAPSEPIEIADAKDEKVQRLA